MLDGKLTSFPVTSFEHFGDQLHKIVHLTTTRPYSVEESAEQHRQMLAVQVATRLNVAAHLVAGDLSCLAEGKGKANLKNPHPPYGLQGRFRYVLFK